MLKNGQNKMFKFLLYLICIALMSQGLGSYLSKYWKMFPDNYIWGSFLILVAIIMLVFIVNFGFIIFGYMPFPA